MQEEKGLYKDRNLQLIFLITLVAVMGVASLAPAFPQVISHFGINKQQVGLLVITFTLPGIFLTPFAGVMADRLGRKVVLIPALLLFAIAGFSCIFTESFRLLLFFRFLQGVGAAPLGSINVTLIGDLYSGSKRSTAMGYNASVLSIGTASYPAIGGLLAMGGWNLPFVLPLLALPLSWLVFRYLQNPEPDEKTEFSAYVKNLLQTLNQKKVYGVFVLNVLVFFLIYGAYITYFPLLMKERLAANSAQIGLTMSVMSFTTAITSFNIGRLSKMMVERKMLLLSTLIYFVSMLILSQVQSWNIIFLPVLLFGFAQGLFLPTVQTLLVGFAPMKQRAAFMSLNSMVLRIGQTIGPAAIGLAYGIGGLTGSYFGGALVALIMALVVLTIQKRL